MRFLQRIAGWLETRWVTPAYSGWLLAGLSLFFFAAATNTMAGWLYVISGMMFALLAIAAVLPARSLRGIWVRRAPIAPVSVGDFLAIELELENRTTRSKTLVQVEELLPPALGKTRRESIEAIPAQGIYRWNYLQPTDRRGIYRWQTVSLRTATPLGLFWCRRNQTATATAVVYPIVLPLTQCPLIDELGRDLNAQVQSSYNPYSATEGLTRTLRPYRWGDPTRLVHWRTSARYGELRVRELEVFTGGQEIVIGLDSAIPWLPEHFEQAVVAAASLYFYAAQHHLQVSVWTAATGIVRQQSVLEALAGTIAGEAAQADCPQVPLLWLTQSFSSLDTLPAGSRWALWQQGGGSITPSVTVTSGKLIQPDQSLQLQLQASLGGGFAR